MHRNTKVSNLVCYSPKRIFVQPKGCTVFLAALKGRPCICVTFRPHWSYNINAPNLAVFLPKMAASGNDASIRYIASARPVVVIHCCNPYPSHALRITGKQRAVMSLPSLYRRRLTQLCKCSILYGTQSYILNYFGL